MRRRKRRKQRKIIIITSLSLLFILTCGYAAFQTNLNITAKGNIVQKEITIDDLKNKVVTSGDGLYIDAYEVNRDIYKGRNPDNYILLNDELWRIVAIESDGTLKVKRDEGLGNRTWDASTTLGSNNWGRPSDINNYLNNQYYISLSDDTKSLITKHDFNIGPVILQNEDLRAQIQSENSVTWNGNVGLISLSDFLRANSNVEICGNYKLHFDNNSVCKETNWLVPNSSEWTISPYKNDVSIIYRIGSGGNPGYSHTVYSDANVAPIVYIRSDITLKGEGTKEEPYIIVNVLQNRES